MEIDIAAKLVGATDGYRDAIQNKQSSPTPELGPALVSDLYLDSYLIGYTEGYSQGLSKREYYRAIKRQCEEREAEFEREPGDVEHSW